MGSSIDYYSRFEEESGDIAMSSDNSEENERYRTTVETFKQEKLYTCNVPVETPFHVVSGRHLVLLLLIYYSLTYSSPEFSREIETDSIRHSVSEEGEYKARNNVGKIGSCSHQANLEMR